MVADFNQLPIPYRAVATDMVSGDMVVLDRGDLATAMRASMAIPGAFSPVPYENYILADGGMVRNIPVDVARATLRRHRHRREPGRAVHAARKAGAGDATPRAQHVGHARSQ